MPVYIQNYIHKLLAKGEVKVVTTCHHPHFHKTELTFTQDGTIKGIQSGATTIWGYLDRLVKFSRKDILIFINDIAITDIPPEKVYEIEYVPELPHA